MTTLNTENKIKITEIIMVFIATLPMGIANIWITKSKTMKDLLSRDKTRKAFSLYKIKSYS